MMNKSILSLSLLFLGVFACLNMVSCHHHRHHDHRGHGWHHHDKHRPHANHNNHGRPYRPDHGSNHAKPKR